MSSTVQSRGGTIVKLALAVALERNGRPLVIQRVPHLPLGEPQVGFKVRVEVRRQKMMTFQQRVSGRIRLGSCALFPIIVSGSNPEPSAPTSPPLAERLFGLPEKEHERLRKRGLYWSHLSQGKPTIITCLTVAWKEGQIKRRVNRDEGIKDE